MGVYKYNFPELSSFTTLALAHLPPFCSPANDYLVDSLPRPLSSTPFLSFWLPFYSLLLPFAFGLLQPRSLASLSVPLYADEAPVLALV